MRYLVSLVVAVALVFVAFWIGSKIAIMVSQGNDENFDFVRGTTSNLCGYEVDHRHSLAGYDLDEWRGERCERLSALDRCLLECLSNAEVVEVAKGCFSQCVEETGGGG